jgi:hypothetical protein
MLHATEWLIPATELCPVCYSFIKAYTEANLHTVLLVDNKRGWYNTFWLVTYVRYCHFVIIQYFVCIDTCMVKG